MCESFSYVNRGITKVLTIIITCSTYLCITAILHYLPATISSSPFVDLTIVTILAVIHNPLHNRLQNYADRLFSGYCYSYCSSLPRTIYHLQKTIDRMLQRTGREPEDRENEKYRDHILLAREEERKSIALELHDQVIQPLVGLNYGLIEIRALSDLTRLNERVTQLEKEVSDLIHTTRTLCHDLRPPVMELGLIPSIRSVISHFETQAGIEVRLTIESRSSVPIQEKITLCLFRCTREALSNIYKHALAKHIEVKLSVEPARVQLIIEDDGQGFVVPEPLSHLAAENHFGLVGIRERLELVNGTFHVTSTPSTGTRIEASIPLTHQLEA